MLIKPAIILIMVAIATQLAYAQDIDANLCEKTYDSSNVSGYSADYVKFYVDNWQSLCSSVINKTLKPEFVCNKIYFFIVSSNYNYSSADVEKLKSEIDKNISIYSSLLNYYIENYWDLCYLQGYSNEPPKKIYPIINIMRGENSTAKCDYSINWFFDLSFQLGRANLGDISCEKIDNLKLWIKIDKDESAYYYDGLKLWYFIVLLSALILALIIHSLKSTNNINRALEKMNYEKM